MSIPCPPGTRCTLRSAAPPDALHWLGRDHLGRDILARLLHNLKEIHRSNEDWPGLLAVQQRLVVLLPQAPEERRDRGLTWAELGRPAEAADDLAAYLAARPDAEDAAALRERLTELRRDGAPRLH